MKDHVAKDEHSQGSSHQEWTATKALVTKDEHSHDKWTVNKWKQTNKMDSQQVKTVLKGTLHHDTEIVWEQWCYGRLTNGKGITEADQAYVCMYVPDLYVPGPWSL